MPCSIKCICLNVVDISGDTSLEEAFVAFICDKHAENAEFSSRQLGFFREELSKLVCKLDKYDAANKMANLNLGSEKAPEQQSFTSPKKGFGGTVIENGTSKVSIQQSKLNKAHGSGICSIASLPEDKERIVYSDFVSKTNKYLRLRLIPTNDEILDHVNGPLGVCFDELAQQWIIADTKNSRILLYPSGDSVSTELIGTPSAVCIVAPGSSFAILSNSHIVVYKRKTQQFQVLLEDSRLNCRGLAISPNGNLVTMRKLANSAFIVVLSSTTPNKQYALLPLDGVNPSFMHMVRDVLIFTDLGNQSVTKCYLNDGDVNNILFSTEHIHDGYKWEGETEEPEGKFAFVSGVQIDNHGWSLIGDARGHTIQLFDAKLNPMYRVSSNFSLPYMSAFFVNNRGQMLICGRQNGHLYLAQLEASPEILPRKEKVEKQFRMAARGQSSRSRGSFFFQRRFGNQ